MHLMYYLENGKRVYTLKVSGVDGCGVLDQRLVEALLLLAVRLVPVPAWLTLRWAELV